MTDTAEFTADWTSLMTGLKARRLSTGYLAVDLSYKADPEGWTEQRITDMKEELSSWQWRKEMERDFGAQAGQPLFGTEALDRMRGQVRKPLYRMDLSDKHELVMRDSGRLAVYMDPSDQPPVLPSGVEHVDRSFGIGIDVSEGVAKSDSALEVFTGDTYEQAAELADSRITPVELGRFAAATGHYFNQALICCVRKVHGLAVLRTMVDEKHYPRVWFERRDHKHVPQKTHDLGYGGSEMALLYMVDGYKDAIQRGALRLSSQQCLNQHYQYIYDKEGRLTIQHLADESPGKRSRHGDMVIACALAYKAICDLPKFQKVMETMTTERWMQEYLRRQRGTSKVWRR